MADLQNKFAVTEKGRVWKVNLSTASSYWSFLQDVSPLVKLGTVFLSICIYWYVHSRETAVSPEYLHIMVCPVMGNRSLAGIAKVCHAEYRVDCTVHNVQTITAKPSFIMLHLNS